MRLRATKNFVNYLSPRILEYSQNSKRHDRTASDNMTGLSYGEILQITQLKAQQKDRWGSAFEHAAWVREFRRRNPECTHPCLLILEPPLDAPKCVRDSVGMSELPLVDHAVLDGDGGEEQQRGEAVRVYRLDDSGHGAVARWILQNHVCSYQHVWVRFKGERRLAMKLTPRWSVGQCI